MLETHSSTSTVNSVRNMVSGVDWTEGTNPHTYDATGLNGLPCMIGNGADSRLGSTEAPVAAAFSGNDTTWAVLVAFEASSVVGGLVSFGSSSSNIPRGSAIVGSAIDAVVPTKASNTGITRTPSVVVSGIRDAPCVLAAICYGDTVWVSRNGLPFAQAVGSFDAGLMTVDTVGLLYRPRQTPDLFSNEKLGEVLIYNRAIDMNDCRGLARAMMGRWGIP